MTQDKSSNDMIDKKLDEFNASAALDGKELDQETLNEIKGMLKSGLSPEECKKKILERYIASK